MANRKMPKAPDGAAWLFYNNIVLPWVSDDCLFWPYGRTGFGYAQVRHDGGPKLVHRLACQAIHGTAPTRAHVVAHSCGMGAKGCCNPRHLRWATRSENEADRVLHGTSNRGERQGQSKLTRAQVLQIRALQGVETQRATARRYDIDQSTVSDIQRRKRWAWLGVPEGGIAA